MTSRDSTAKIPGGGNGPGDRTIGPLAPIPDLAADEADAFVRAIGEPFLVPLHRLVLPPNVPAGLSLWTLVAIAGPRRNGGRQVHDPVWVRRHPEWPGGWQLVDGRHRFAAALTAGCPDVLCVEVP